MWYNPEIYVVNQGLTTEQILWAMYQHQVATTGVIICAVIFYFFFRFIVWFYPNFWRKKRTRKEQQ